MTIDRLAQTRLLPPCAAVERIVNKWIGEETK